MKWQPGFLIALVLVVSTLACGFGTAAPRPIELTLPAAEFPTAPRPPPYELVVQPTASPSVPLVVAPPPAIPEPRRLTVEYPPRVRVGDSGLIRLTLEVDDLGRLTPTAEVAGNATTGQVVQIPNLYETHHVMAEARLDLLGVQVRPEGLVSEPLLPRQAVTFFWNVRPSQAGTFRGTLWFHLRFVDKASGQESGKTVAAPSIQIEATTLLGLNASVARFAGGLGSFVGAVLGLPFVDEMLKWLWQRMRRRS